MTRRELAKLSLGSLGLSLDRPLLIGVPHEPAKRIEVCRSFAYKLNLQNHGGNPYESADFFASRKMECEAEAAEWVSDQIYEECVAEVRASVAAFIEEMRRKKAVRAGEPSLSEQRRMGVA